MISVSNVSVSFGGVYLYEEISFLINKQDRIGLAGKNGAGKSTLLKILYGEMKPDSGEIAKPNGVTLGYLPQDMVHNLGKTVFDETATAFGEIKSLVTKTVGMHDVLYAALDPMRRKINLAFVYGSVARSGETERSDVDLMVVGKVEFSIVVSKLADAQKILNREINPTVYSVKEFRGKVRGNFLKTVLAEKKLFIIGDENVLRELGQK